MDLKILVSLFLIVSYAQCSNQAPRFFRMDEKGVSFIEDSSCNQAKRIGCGCGSILCCVGFCGCIICHAVSKEICEYSYDGTDGCEHCSQALYSMACTNWKRFKYGAVEKSEKSES